MLTLFHPASGQVRLEPVARSTNAIVHPWLKARLAEIVAALPAVAAPLDREQNRRVWQAGLTVRFTLPDELPPLRLLLIWDNLTGHRRRRWCCGCAGTASCRSIHRWAAAG
jgi:hypothetical protein